MATEFNFKNIFLAGIGGAAYSIEKTQSLVEELVKKGEITVQQGKVLNDELKHNVSDKLRSAAKKVDASAGCSVIDRVEQMTAEDRAALKAKLEEMEKKAIDGAEEKTEE